jgi:hypothetical protein
MTLPLLLGYLSLSTFSCNKEDNVQANIFQQRVSLYLEKAILMLTDDEPSNRS